MDQTFAPPPPPPPPFVPPPPAEAPIPWEQPGRPPVEAMVETVKLFLTDMEQAFRRMPPTGDIARPLLYAVIVGSIGPIVAQIYSVFLPHPFVGMLRQYLSRRAGRDLPFSETSGLFGVFFVPVGVVIGVLIGAAILHLCLMLVGGPNSGFVTTLRVVCYANTGQLAQLIPMIGGILALIFVLVLEVRGLSTAHRTTIGKATAAVLIPLAACCVCLIVVIAALGAVVAGLLSR